MIKIFVIEDAGPIGLSLMVTMAEAYLQFLESKSLREALNCSPKTFRRYVDDSHGRFESLEKAEQFLMVLNSQDTKFSTPWITRFQWYSCISGYLN